MLKSRALKAAFAVVISCTVLAAPVFANPGNGNGGGGPGFRYYHYPDRHPRFRCPDWHRLAQQAH